MQRAASVSAQQEAINDLEAEMKLLRWHKLANTTALQSALIRTRQMRRHDKAMKPASMMAERREKKERIQRAIEEENSKPLMVSQNVATDFSWCQNNILSLTY